MLSRHHFGAIIIFYFARLFIFLVLRMRRSRTIKLALEMSYFNLQNCAGYMNTLEARETSTGRWPSSFSGQGGNTHGSATVLHGSLIIPRY